MRSIALIPGCALVAGAVAGSMWPNAVPPEGWLVVVLALAWGAWWRRAGLAAVPLACAGFLLAGAALGGVAERAAQDSSLRRVLHEAFGGFDRARVEAAGMHPPIRTRLRLTEDASRSDGGVRLRGIVERVWLGADPCDVAGGVLVTVSGALAEARLETWRAGRRIEAPVTYRRPTRYLTVGVGDAEATAARQGISLFGRIKSGLAVELVERGPFWTEWAADVRATVRRRVAAHIPGASAGAHAREWAGVEAGIVTALLIGDRTAIPTEVREQLQAAGTYHVIAISGGNIAVLVLLATAVLRLAGAGPRVAAGIAVPVLLGYAAVVVGGPSVRRAVIMAVTYLGARALNVRAPVWNTLAVSAGVLVCLDPLDARDAGFWLTFGATVALISAGRLAGHVVRRPGERETGLWSRAGRWLLATVHASMLVELVILPVTVLAFSRVPMAGIAANLVAVPAMTVAQVAGLGIAAGLPGVLADISGVLAGTATDALLASSAIAAWAPWLTPRVPPPPLWAWVVYAVLLGATWRSRWPVTSAAAVCLLVATWANWPGSNPRGNGRLTLTALDVGQGEALLLRLPDGQVLLVDAGGGTGGGVEVGERVVGPALWARGIRRLDGLVITHADPDHVGGAVAVLRDFAPAVLWTGIRVAGHEPTVAVERMARAAGVRQAALTDGDVLVFGPVSIRVLHPERPDWERPKVRNDDSIVLEVRYGDVALLLTGDAGVAVERAVLDRLSPARLRILKVGHHGSRTSTGRQLVERWRPNVAVVSCGRGNSFGHPAPDVVNRLVDSGAAVRRTDRDGEVTIETDGRDLTVRTFATNPRSPPS